MSFEMAQDNHAFGTGYVASNGNRPEMFFIDCYRRHVLSREPVCNNYRCTSHCKIKPVQNSSSNMVHRIRPAPPIKCISIGQEWITAASFDFFHDLPNIDRSDIPVISPFTKMEFDRGFVIFTDGIRKPGAVKETLHF